MMIMKNSVQRSAINRLGKNLHCDPVIQTLKGLLLGHQDFQIHTYENEWSKVKNSNLLGWSTQNQFQPTG